MHFRRRRVDSFGKVSESGGVCPFLSCCVQKISLESCNCSGLEYSSGAAVNGQSSSRDGFYRVQCYKQLSPLTVKSFVSSLMMRTCVIFLKIDSFNEILLIISGTYSCCPILIIRYLIFQISSVNVQGLQPRAIRAQRYIGCRQYEREQMVSRVIEKST